MSDVSAITNECSSLRLTTLELEICLISDLPTTEETLHFRVQTCRGRLNLTRSTTDYTTSARVAIDDNDAVLTDPFTRKKKLKV